MYEGKESLNGGKRKRKSSKTKIKWLVQTERKKAENTIILEEALVKL